jgi:hypothetical protein
VKSRLAAALLLAANTGLCGCSAFAPYPTYPQQPAAGQKDAGARVAICYDLLVSSRDEVQKTAQAECAPNTVAKRADTDWKLDYCPLLLPARATFVCASKK